VRRHRARWSYPDVHPYPYGNRHSYPHPSPDADADARTNAAWRGLRQAYSDARSAYSYTDSYPSPYVAALADADGDGYRNRDGYDNRGNRYRCYNPDRYRHHNRDGYRHRNPSFGCYPSAAG